MCHASDLDRLEQSADYGDEFNNWINVNRADYLALYFAMQSDGVSIERLRQSLRWAFEAGRQA